jgi:hypothetical protein
MRETDRSSPFGTVYVYKYLFSRVLNCTLSRLLVRVDGPHVTKNVTRIHSLHGTPYIRISLRVSLDGCYYVRSELPLQRTTFVV